MECLDCRNLPARHRDSEGQLASTYFGYCAACWKDLTPEQRAILKGEEPPVKEIIHEVQWLTPPLPDTKIAREEIHVPPLWKMPPRPDWKSRLAVGIWRAAVTAGIGYLLWRR